MNSSSLLDPAPALRRPPGILAPRANIMAHEFLGVTPRRWLEYLVAILVGNAIYYFSLVPHLPNALRHQGFRTDWGVLVDFAVCVAVYGLIRLGFSL
jgi:hypothetical protein